MMRHNRFAQAKLQPYWPETVKDPLETAPLDGDVTCDLAIVGGGFAGLWSALKASERFPDARILLLEAGQIGNAASGRNGGFCAPSISRGIENAVNRWPNEAETLVRLGRENLDGLEQDLLHYGIDGGFERSGKLNVATTPWQVQGLRQLQVAYSRFGNQTEFLEGSALDAYLKSPRYRAGLFDTNYALVNPARLVDGLAKAAVARGAQIHEETTVDSMTNAGDGVRLRTAGGMVKAGQVILATNAAVPLLRSLRRTFIPIWNYTLLSEPLSDDHLTAIGWQGRHGISDSGSQFHYFRKTEDNRILWGGSDAVYNYGAKRDQHLNDRHETYQKLEKNFYEAFPALVDVGFTHRWGGIIDISARLTAFVGTAMQGRLTYAMGFSGQGVAATRLAALTMLDRLESRETERTRLAMLTDRPVRFPPEPFCNWAVKWSQADMAREDRTGRRSALLRTMSRFRTG